MVVVVNAIDENSPLLFKVCFHNKEVSTFKDRYDANKVDGEMTNSIEIKDDDFIIPKLELEKVKMLQKGRKDVKFEATHEKPKCKFEKSHRNFYKCHRKFCKQELNKK